MKLVVGLAVLIFILSQWVFITADHSTEHEAKIVAKVIAYKIPPEYIWFKGYKLGAQIGEINAGIKVVVHDSKEVGYPWYKEQWYLVSTGTAKKGTWIYGGTKKRPSILFLTKFRDTPSRVKEKPIKKN